MRLVRVENEDAEVDEILGSEAAYRGYIVIQKRDMTD